MTRDASNMSSKLISDTRRIVREDFIMDTESTFGVKLQIVLYLGIPRLDWCHITTVDISFRRTFRRQIKIFFEKKMSKTLSLQSNNKWPFENTQKHDCL